MGRKGLGAALALVLLLLPIASLAGSEEVHKRGLRGLNGVYIAVQVDPQAEHLGLIEAQILKDIELRLRKAGVRILTKKECFETPGAPYLSVRIETKIDQGHVAYITLVELVERVTLARGFINPGAIWNSASVGIVGASNIGEIRKDVGDRVDNFIRDYLEMNPR